MRWALTVPKTDEANRVGTAPQPICLSPREFDVMVGLAAGNNCREVADALGISVKTVDTHRQHVLIRLGLRNAADLARYALRYGLLDFDGNPNKEARQAWSAQKEAA